VAKIGSYTKEDLDIYSFALTAAEVEAGLGRIVALHDRPSTSHQIHERIRCLYI
jgi:hypothetical protein